MKESKRIISVIIAIVLALSININTNTENTYATEAFYITSPTENQILAAGDVTITWSRASSSVKGYNVYVDGRFETSTTDTSCNIYTTEVYYHTVWVEAVLNDGTVKYTDTVKFGVSKKGICVDKNMGKCLSPDNLNISWYYNWGTTGFKTITQDSRNDVLYADDFNKLDFVPMVWSSNSYADTARKVNAAVTSGAKYVLGYNEPDYKDQANMSVDKVIQLWPAFMNKNIKVGSPATAIWPTSSKNWFIPFMDKINERDDLDVDFITIHCYPDNYQGKGMADWFLKEVVDACWNKYHKPIWVTELSTSGNQITRDGTYEFVKNVMPGLDERDYVERYTLFSFDASNNQAGLWYYSSGALTKAGEAYRDNGNPVKLKNQGNEKNPKYNSNNNNKDNKPTPVKTPGKASVKSLKNIRKRKVKVTYKKVKYAKGYQIRIAENKRFNGYWNKYSTKTNCTFTRLDKNTRYYVKVRAYTKKGNKKVYGKWSKAKSIVVKK